MASPTSMKHSVSSLLKVSGQKNLDVFAQQTFGRVECSHAQTFQGVFFFFFVKGTNCQQKTCEIYVYNGNFKLDFTCWTTLIFLIMKMEIMW